jgi:hypothetical protein
MRAERVLSVAGAYSVSRSGGLLDRQSGARLKKMGLRGIEWAKLGYEGARKLCIS